LYVTEWPDVIREAAREAEGVLRAMEDELRQRSDLNHQKVLAAFQREQVAAYHFHGTTGYGLGDAGRTVLDRVTARILGTEAAIVRSQFVSGTHAIAAALFGILRPGDHFLAATGAPYDTLEEVIGIRGQGLGSLRDFGVAFDAVPLRENGAIHYELLDRAIRKNTRMIFLQRSCGYTWRPSLSIRQIGELVRHIKNKFSDRCIFVDNCYGELVETLEPGDVGVDLVAGSLIKNLGGGLAPTGAYVAGKADLVEKAAARLTAPGIGGNVGATLDSLRLYFQGLFQSPLTVAEALKGAVFAAAFWQALGYEVHPEPTAARTDLIQAIKLGNRERMIAFCQGIQKGSPVDSYVSPEPSGMPGYGDEVIMAGGTFIQGATSEFSADGPLREPYAVYQQGGISYPYIRIGNILAAVNLYEKGLLK
jgi:cystathionine beta-lyase family protein involved in aluminum resistance